MIFRVENRISDAGLPVGDNQDHGVFQIAIVFAAIGMGLAVLVAPVLHRTIKTYTEARITGIDRIVTGTVHKGSRYTIRKSVLYPGIQTLCESNEASSCPIK